MDKDRPSDDTDWIRCSPSSIVLGVAEAGPSGRHLAATVSKAEVGFSGDALAGSASMRVGKVATKAV